MIVNATRLGMAGPLVAAVALVASAHAEQANPRESASIAAYEAEELTTFTEAGRPERTRQSKVYRAADGSVREESPEGVRITNAKSRTVAVLSPDLRQALVAPMPLAGRPAPLPRQSAVAPVRDMVNGRPTLKYESLSDQSRRSRIWVDIPSGAIVYSEFSFDTTTVTKVLRNIKFGPVPQSLFEVPKDYSQTPMELSEAPPAKPSGRSLVRPEP